MLFISSGETTRQGRIFWISTPLGWIQVYQPDLMVAGWSAWSGYHPFLPIELARLCCLQQEFVMGGGTNGAECFLPALVLGVGEVLLPLWLPGIGVNEFGLSEPSLSTLLHSFQRA